MRLSSGSCHINNPYQSHVAKKMPLTKQYLTYHCLSSFGLVTGRSSNALLVSGRDRPLVASPCLDKVTIWDPKTSNKVKSLSCEGEVSVVGLSPDSSRLVGGCESGKVHVWGLSDGQLLLTLSGHKSAVSCLSFSGDGTRVVSGSKDTTVIMWDLIAECGMYRLKGHKGPITDCRIVSEHNVLITSSKDGLVKVWDLDTRHCFQTIPLHRAEVWSLEVVGSTLITGSNRLTHFKLRPLGDKDKVPLVVTEEGQVTTSGQERVLTLKADREGRHLVSLRADSTLEVFLVLTPEEIEKKEKKKAKKALKKEQEVAIKSVPPLKSICRVKCQSKVRSFDVLRCHGEIWILTVLHSNSLELHTITDSQLHLKHSITAPGHRSDVRTACFSSDDAKILTGSAETVKIWNTDTQHCVCTLSSGYTLCSTFAPGDRHAVVGTKEGSVQVFDLSSASLIADLSTAHTGAVWSLVLTPDRRGVVSGSADQTVKFWDFELENQKLSLSHIRTLKMSEDVLCVRFSPDGRLLAVALLDSTIKLFFVDSLKFFLSLYGHKLPILSMDISSDSTLLASCSADKNIRVWGLDFGDCHKSLFAHDQSVSAISFLPGTHQLVSAGKDGLVKRWDADSFEHIQTLEGHCAEVWCLAVSSNGGLVVSGSHDHSVRVWERTQEPLVLSEQRELEREKALEQLAGGAGPERVVPGEKEEEAVLPSTRSKDTVSAADRLMEALLIWREDKATLEEHKSDCALAKKELPVPSRHPILIAMGDIKSERYVLNVLKSIRSSELEEALLVLPFHQAVSVLELCDYWLQSRWEVELTCRCLLFLMRVHHNQLTGTHDLQPLITRLQAHTHSTISKYKGMFGVNLAGLCCLKEQLARGGQEVFGDARELLRKKLKRT